MKLRTFVIATALLAGGCQFASKLGGGSSSTPSSGSGSATSDSSGDSGGSSAGKPTVTTENIAGYEVASVETTSCDGQNAIAVHNALSEANGSVLRASGGLFDAANRSASDQREWPKLTPEQGDAAIASLQLAISKNRFAAKSFSECRDFFDAQQLDSAKRQMANYDQLDAQINDIKMPYTAALMANEKVDATTALYRMAQSKRESECTKAEMKVYYAWRNPENDQVNYEFCDGVTVEHRADGDWVRQTPTLNGHPEWDKVMAKDMAELEDARKRVELLGTEKAKQDAARVEKEFSAAMQRFIKKYYPEAKYVAMAKKSKLMIATGE